MDLIKLKKYYEDLKKEFENEEIYPPELLNIAKDFVVHENISQERKNYSSQQKSEESKEEENPNLPTKKQLDFAEKLGIEIPKNVTKLELIKIIKEALEKNKKKEDEGEEY